MIPLFVAADSPVRITGFVGPGFLIHGVNGKNHDLSGIDPGSPHVSHTEIFKVKKAPVLTGDIKDRPACVSIDLALHVSVKCRTVLLKILRFHKCFLLF